MVATQTSDRGAIHDLILGYSVVLIACVRSSACGLSLYYLNLHVLDLDSHQNEVYFTDYHVLQVISAARRCACEQMTPDSGSYCLYDVKRVRSNRAGERGTGRGNGG